MVLRPRIFVIVFILKQQEWSKSLFTLHEFVFFCIYLFLVQYFPTLMWVNIHFNLWIQPRISNICFDFRVNFVLHLVNLVFFFLPFTMLKHCCSFIFWRAFSNMELFFVLFQAGKVCLYLTSVTYNKCQGIDLNERLVLDICIQELCKKYVLVLVSWREYNLSSH